ncbi:hypothetical protein C8R48DRAFT_668141 [Suillus tomentosus]|nr:hypothetical protein C8R48DRAFT_668141 [Suillus tomentosus]
MSKPQFGTVQECRTKTEWFRKTKNQEPFSGPVLADARTMDWTKSPVQTVVLDQTAAALVMTEQTEGSINKLRTESFIAFLGNALEFFVAHISTFKLAEDCCEMYRYELICCEEVHELIQKIVRILPYETKQTINIFTIKSTQTTTYCRSMVHNVASFAPEPQNPKPGYCRGLEGLVHGVGLPVQVSHHD